MVAPVCTEAHDWRATGGCRQVRQPCWENTYTPSTESPSTVRSCSGSCSLLPWSFLSHSEDLKGFDHNGNESWQNIPCSERDRVATGAVAGLLLEHQFCSCWNVPASCSKIALLQADIRQLVHPVWRHRAPADFFRLPQPKLKTSLQ